MSNDPKQQAASEAGQMLASAQSLHERGVGPEVDSYCIKSFPREAYRPASFVRKTASPELFSEFCDLLEQLWEINEEHVGEEITQVNVYFTLTGIHTSLSDRLTEWCRHYLALRIDRDNPQDHGNSFYKYKRLLAEYTNAFGVRGQSLDYLVADASLGFAAWYLFDHTWKCDVSIIQDGFEVRVGVTPSNSHVQQYVLAQIQKFRLGLNGLSAFLDDVADSSPTARLAELNRLGDMELLQQIAAMAGDLMEMRLILARNFNPEKTVLSLSTNLAIACAWAATHGIVQLLVGPSEQALLENIPSRRTTRHLALRLDGLLIEAKRPWLTVRDVPSPNTVSGIAVNCYVLELIHEKLLSFYLQIDFDRICQRAGDGAHSLDDELVAVSCRDLSADDEAHPISETESKTTTTRRIPSIRMVKFLRVLERLNCEVKSGKGDETTVYRVGGKKYRLGHIKEVHAELVKNVIKRLGISTQEWLSASSR